MKPLIEILYIVPNSVILFGFFDMIFVKNTEAYILVLFKWSTDRRAENHRGGGRGIH